MFEPVYIREMHCFPVDLWPDSIHPNPFVYKEGIGWVRAVPKEEEAILRQIMSEKSYKELDRTVHLAIAALRKFSEELNADALFIGSSRVSTGKWEEIHSRFVEGLKMRPRYSPVTTFGNLSHTLGHILALNGMQTDVSQTCSSGLQALLMGISWLNSGMGSEVLCGASEAALTPFTSSILAATGITQQTDANDRPRTNGLFLDGGTVLGEASGLLLLSKEKSDVQISGWGAAMETGKSATGISSQGLAYEISMGKACNGRIPEMIVLHAPGTALGDAAERNAVKSLFGELQPKLIGTKGITGHCLGAAGIVSLYWAYQLLRGHQNPYCQTAPPLSILVNAMGFGGNAVSIFLERKK
jgi:3-oxoacyl-[acyl-carrier-protein] synthase II